MTIAPQRPTDPPNSAGTSEALRYTSTPAISLGWTKLSIDSFELARATGETVRADRYRLALVNSMRSLKQVMYKGDQDMYYIRRRDFLVGGCRTQVYNNVIRIDNVQHNQMALLKILRAFEDARVHRKSIKPYINNGADFHWHYGLADAAAGDYKEAKEV